MQSKDKCSEKKQNTEISTTMLHLLEIYFKTTLVNAFRVMKQKDNFWEISYLC